MDAIDIRFADLTGRARIRHAALHLFGTEGYARTSLRSIAHKAGVSLALIAHHFGSKHQLRDAVDVWVLAMFEGAVRDAAGGRNGGSDEAVCRSFADAVGDVLTARPEVRAYLRRMIVVDGTTSGVALLTSLLGLIRKVVACSWRSDDERDLTRQSLQWMLLLLGPALLEPVLHRCVSDLFAESGPRDPSAPARPGAAAATEAAADAAGRMASFAGSLRPTRVMPLPPLRFRH